MDKQPLVIEQRIRDMMQYGHIALIVVCARRACKHLAAALQPV